MIEIPPAVFAAGKTGVDQDRRGVPPGLTLFSHKGGNMAKNQTVRIRPIVLEADRQASVAVREMAGYAPANPAYSQAAMSDRLAALQAAQELEIRAENALDAARDNTVAAEWEFHNFMLGVKAQVTAQYGPDSNEVQALGLTKKSERKTAGRRKEVTGA
jgi:hypothetical protein